MIPTPIQEAIDYSFDIASTDLTGILKDNLGKVLLILAAFIGIVLIVRFVKRFNSL